MSPATYLLIGLALSVLHFLGTMLYISSKFGEYKNKVDSLPEDVKETKGTVQALHERFDAFYHAMLGYENRLGQAEGELKRINGKGH